MEALVKNLLAAYKQSIDKLDWMSPATKKEARPSWRNSPRRSAIRTSGRIIRSWWSNATTWSAT
jgi:hypothetical protein